MAEDDNYANTSYNRKQRIKNLANDIYNKLTNYTQTPTDEPGVTKQTEFMQNDLNEIAGWASNMANDIWNTR